MDNTLATPAITLRHYALVFGVCLLLWVLLVGNLDAQELLAGVVVSALITLLFGSRFGILTGFRFSLLAPLYMLVYLGNFMVALVRANLDLALRVISPSLPINPALVKVKTSLKSPLGKLLLANTITLTPGTLTVDVIDDTLLVHWVYCPPGTDMQQATDKIAASFERHLGRFLL
jgi:multicomponent Na+:H+ antiporter subunit E